MKSRGIKYFLTLTFVIFVYCSDIRAENVNNQKACEVKTIINVKDGLGRNVTIQALPQRIVSTVPSNTEILYDLGLKDKVIAVTSHCAKTCDISEKTIIGGWSEPKIVEKIVSLNPDLVLAFGGLQRQLSDRLEQKGITTFVFFPRTVDQNLEQILLVGKITGKYAQANKIVTRCRNNLKKIEQKFKGIPTDKRIKCLRLMSTEAMVIGGTSFQNDVIKKAGGINVFEHIKDDYPIVSLEDVKIQDPDVIVFNRDDEKKAVEWFMSQDGWCDLRAAKNGNLMSISCDYICHPNTRVDKTVEKLAKGFYPSNFELHK
ncbi:MAG: ABC transporter substrate-binding protein [Thermodesulfobacteriota bacterium]|nr:ABC transporter substrate-binding protein [Thermodesulfobacteriota bacterium]